MKVVDISDREIAKGTSEEAKEHAATYRWLEASLRKEGQLPSLAQFARQIAMDHLLTDKTYYSKGAQNEKYIDRA